MGERLAPGEKRQEFSASVRKAALERAGGRCEGCGEILRKGFYTFDHTLPWRRGGKSTPDNCKVLCTQCDKVKTYTQDLPGIAAHKRHSKNRLPLDIGRPEKKPGSIQGRGFDKGPSRPIPGRAFPKRRKTT